MPKWISLITAFRFVSVIIYYPNRWSALPVATSWPNYEIEIRRKTTKTVDYRFQCNKMFYKSGRNEVQLRKGSWFEGAIISYRKSILLAYCFLYKLTYKHAIQETSISSTDDSDEERVLLTSETVSDCYNYCREVCSRIVENESSKPIGGGGGGEGVRWEVDEAKFGKRKSKGGD